MTLRIEHGQDIAAACGQLALSNDIEDAGGKKSMDKKKKKLRMVKRRKNKNTANIYNHQNLIQFASAFFFILALVFLALYFVQSSTL